MERKDLQLGSVLHVCGGVISGRNSWQPRYFSHVSSVVFYGCLVYPYRYLFMYQRRKGGLSIFPDSHWSQNLL